MTVWCFQKLLELFKTVNQVALEETCKRVGMTPDVVERIRDIQSKMCVHFTVEGVIEQYEGYQKLPMLDLERYTLEERNRIADVLQADGLSVEDYAVDKQPDTLMVYYMLSPMEVYKILLDLGYDIQENEAEFLRKNFGSLPLRCGPVQNAIRKGDNQICQKFVPIYFFEQCQTWRIWETSSKAGLSIRIEIFFFVP